MTGELPLVGQRWLSEAEPDLGLGLVVEVTARAVVIEFRACEERRTYALASAALHRAALRPGDTAVARDKRSVEVVGVDVREGILHYIGAGGEEISEADLCDTLSLGTPEDRLAAGHVDGAALFDLRRAALALEHRRRCSRVRGFVGARIDLIPHQLSIASEVAGRHAPRVLLADEVGLGKGIEAGMIMHRLLQTERAHRVLVVVPEALMLQWFVELLRRFDLHPALASPEWWAEPLSQDANPFADESLVLCPIQLLAQQLQARQALAAGWDLLVVDEAHHLRWAPRTPSPEYRVVEALARSVPGVLLLTATPEQLGLAGHFARLRLLDPARYTDPAELERAAERCRPTAAVVEALSGAETLSDAQVAQLGELLADEPQRSRVRLLALARGDADSRAEVIEALIDRHGTGRAVFRNTRAAIGGFPSRRVHLVPLEAPGKEGVGRDAMDVELDEDLGAPASETSRDLSGDPRIAWLASLLRELGDAKVLLICRTPGSVRAIDEALRRALRVQVAVFHEGLELIQRDRQAAWFSEPDGARILIASELGSEGRNFQFAHHLVLFDLPRDPELLEQRIGRLDRIGQRETIEIHVPYVVGTSQQALAVWYDEALDAFTHPGRTGRAMAEQFGERLLAVARACAAGDPGSSRDLATLVDETRRLRRQREDELARSRDRLLELSSNRPERALALQRRIQEVDADPTLERLLLGLWSHLLVSVEDLAPRTYLVGREGSLGERIPGLPARGLGVTFDRARALAREDLAFLTWDHPMVTGILDQLFGRPDGNAAATLIAGAPETGLWLETVHVLECVAAPSLHVDRFLAPTPLRRVVADDGRDVTVRGSELLGRGPARGVPPPALAHLDRARLRRLVEHAERAVEAERAQLVEEAGRRMRGLLDREIERLRSLAAINPAVRPDEIAALETEREALATAIAGARLRLDALRVLFLQRDTDARST